MQMTPYGANQYRQQDVETASPIRLVVMAYDLAIRSCEKKDVVTAIKAVDALKRCLDYDYAEVAVGLFSLYNWVIDCLGKGDFTNAKHTLVELRTAWSTVERRMNETREPVVKADFAGVTANAYLRAA
jgi:flagellin-specific chaperone FliS